MSDVLEMTAGREMDRFVAEMVMGWTDVRPNCFTLCGTLPNGEAGPWPLPGPETVCGECRWESGMSDRAIACNGCGKQRWAPRVPEAMHGWKRLPSGQWECAECCKEQLDAATLNEICNELRVLRAVALSMPTPKLGEWNWPGIAERVDALLGKIGDHR